MIIVYLFVDTIFAVDGTTFIQKFNLTITLNCSDIVASRDREVIYVLDANQKLLIAISFSLDTPQAIIVNDTKFIDLNTVSSELTGISASFDSLYNIDFDSLSISKVN